MSADELMAFYEQNMSGRGRGGWEALAHMFGTSKGAMWEIAHGKREMTPRQKLRWRMIQDLQDAFAGDIEFTDAIPCMSCGVVHGSGLDCHNQPGQVAIIPEGARIVAPSKRKRPPYRRPTWAMVRALEARIAELEKRNRELALALANTTLVKAEQARTIDRLEDALNSEALWDMEVRNGNP